MRCDLNPVPTDYFTSVATGLLKIIPADFFTFPLVLDEYSTKVLDKILELTEYSISSLAKMDWHLAPP